MDFAVHCSCLKAPASLTFPLSEILNIKSSQCSELIFGKERNCLPILFPGSGHIKEVIVAGDHVFENPNGDIDGEITEGQDSPDDREQGVSTELIKVKLLVNKEGRYVCELCQKTFKTVRFALQVLTAPSP